MSTGTVYRTDLSLRMVHNSPPRHASINMYKYLLSLKVLYSLRNNQIIRPLRLWYYNFTVSHSASLDDDFTVDFFKRFLFFSQLSLLLQWFSCILFLAVTPETILTKVAIVRFFFLPNRVEKYGGILNMIKKQEHKQRNKQKTKNDGLCKVLRV